MPLSLVARPLSFDLLLVQSKGRRGGAGELCQCCGQGLWKSAWVLPWLPNTYTTPSAPVSPPSARGSSDDAGSSVPLQHRRTLIGTHKILLFSYLGSQAPTQAAHKSLPASGQILALVSDGARQQLSQVQALNPWLWVPLACPFSVLFLFAQKSCGNRKQKKPQGLLTPVPLSPLSGTI